MNILDEYYGNRSYRKFEQRKIEQEKLDVIVEALRLSHSANNRQQLRFVVVNSENVRKQMASAVHYAASLPKEIGTPKEDEEAMGYIVICRPDDKSAITDIDAGIASERITASAWKQGIGSCIIMNFNPTEVSKIIEVENGYIPRIVISLGYPKITSVIEEETDDLKYWVDEDGGYHVPKRSTKHLVRYI